MFAPLRLEVSDRILAIEIFFKGVCRQADPAVKITAKGLSFVQMYAVYEFTTREAVKAAILDIKAKGLSFQDVRLELLGLLLDPECKAAGMAGAEKQWSRRIEMLRKTGCPDAIDTPDTTFPVDGNHFRKGQLETIWSLFGLTGKIVPDGRIYPLIEEIVGHRNAIAHGRSRSEDIGGRFSEPDIIEKIDQCKRLCLHIVTELETHCASVANLSR